MNDANNGTDPEAFRGHVEQILQTLLSNGVIPVVSTIQPNPANPNATNAINTALIQAVENVEAANNTTILVYNLWRAYSALPNNGLEADNVTPTSAPGGPGDLSAGANFAMNSRNRDTMVILNELRNFVFPDATP